MPVLKLTLNEEQYQELQNMAQKDHQSIQDYIRSQIFGINTIFTPEEAVKRIYEHNYDVDFEFTLPDIYGEDWTIERGPAGVFGKKFYRYVTDNPKLGIQFCNMGKYGRRAVYKMVKNIA